MATMEQIKGTLEDAFKDKMRVLWYNIIVIVALTICFVITALVAASAADSKSFGFVAVWTALLSALFVIAAYFLYKRDDSSTHGEQDSERALTAFAILLMMADLFMCGLVATSTNVLLPSSSEAMNPAPPAATAAADSAHYNGSGYDTGKLTDTTAADTYEGAPDGSDAADVEVQADTAV